VAAWDGHFYVLEGGGGNEVSRWTFVGNHVRVIKARAVVESSEKVVERLKKK